jgi:hypothetical protein
VVEGECGFGWLGLSWATAGEELEDGIALFDTLDELLTISFAL